MLSCSVPSGLFCAPMNYGSGSPVPWDFPGSLELVVIPCSRGSSWPGTEPVSPYTGRWGSTDEPPGKSAQVILQKRTSRTVKRYPPTFNIYNQRLQLNPPKQTAPITKWAEERTNISPKRRGRGTRKDTQHHIGIVGKGKPNLRRCHMWTAVRMADQERRSLQTRWGCGEKGTP